MIALLLASLALAAPGAPCGTAEALEAWRRAGAVPLTGPLGVPATVPYRDGAPKAVRDALGTFDTYETTNFAIKWGAMTSFTQADVQALGAAFEKAWATEVAGMGYPAPLQTTGFKFNVYLGDTGEGTPSSSGNAGYYWYDDEGFPMIVVAGNTVADRDWVALTAAHEFFHAVQDAAGMFAWGPRSSWWVEASAVWMEGEVYPDERDQAYFLYWFAIRPELPLPFYEYPTDGNVEEYHQYGAFVFVEHLEENVGGEALVHDVIMGTGDGQDPLDTLDTLQNAHGSDLDVVFDEFVGRNATWDYEHEDWYEEVIDDFGGWTGDSHRPTASLAEDTRGWIDPPADAARTWGANYWVLRGFEGEEVVRFDGDPEGDPPRAWSVQVAVQDGAEHRRIPVPLVDGEGSITGADLGAHDEAWLVVAPMDYTGGRREWAYRVAFEGHDDGPDDTGVDEEPRACACASGPGGSAPRGILGATVATVVWLSSVRRRIERRSLLR